MNSRNTRPYFQLVYKAFWLLWILFPFLIYMVIDWPSLTLNGFVTPDALCAGNAPKLLSPHGQKAVWLLLITNIGFSCALMGLMHRLLYIGAYVDVFIPRSLTIMRIFAFVLLGDSLLTPLLENLAKYFLTFTGDVLHWSPVYDFDLLTFAAGLFAWAFSAILEEGLRMQEDLKLTI